MVLSLRDEGGATDRASTLLGAQAFVREISADGDQVRLYVEDGSAALPQILRLLDAEQIGIRSMSVSEPTLDDVFLRQTGRSLRDAGATANKRGQHEDRPRHRTPVPPVHRADAAQPGVAVRRASPRPCSTWSSSPPC